MATASGRLGVIIDTVEIVLNNEAGIAPDQFTEAELIILANLCTRQLARDDLWKKVDTFSTVASTASYNLATEFTDFVHLFGVRYVGSASDYSYALKPFSSWNQYQNCATVITSGTPRAYWLENRLLYLYPTPDAAGTDAIQVRYSYLPTAFDSVGATSYTPAIPESEDSVYTWFLAWKMCEKFSDNDRAMQKMGYFAGLYETEKAALEWRQTGPKTMRPPR